MIPSRRLAEPGGPCRGGALGRGRVCRPGGEHPGAAAVPGGTVTILVGAAPGPAYDLYARMLAKFGEPGVVEAASLENEQTSVGIEGAAGNIGLAIVVPANLYL